MAAAASSSTCATPPPEPSRPTTCGPSTSPDARFLHVMGSALALSESSRAACYRAATLATAAGARVSLDPNLRPELLGNESVRDVCRPGPRRGGRRPAQWRRGAHAHRRRRRRGGGARPGGGPPGTPGGPQARRERQHRLPRMQRGGRARLPGDRGRPDRRRATATAPLSSSGCCAAGRWSAWRASPTPSGPWP